MKRKDTTWRDSRRFVRNLGLPPVRSVRELLPVVEEWSGYSIRLAPVPVDSNQGVCGMWIRTVEGVDYIFIHEGTSRAHQDHIIAHELAHILCDHDGGLVLPQVASTTDHVVTALDPAVVKMMLGRTNYDHQEEKEAELVGSFLQRHVHRPVGSLGVMTAWQKPCYAAGDKSPVQQFLHPISLALAVVGFLLLLRPPRFLRRDPALAALTGIFGFFALSFLLSLEPVWRLLDDATDRPSTGSLASQACVVVLLALQPVVLAYWALPPEQARKRARLSLAAGALVIVFLTVLFFQLTPADGTTPQGITANYIHTAIYQAYMGTYIIAYTVGQTALAVGCWKASHRTDQPWIARGLRVVGAGAVVTLGYSIVRLAGLGAALLHLSPPPSAAENAAWICADGGTALTKVGYLMPGLAVHVVPHVRAWVRAHRDFRSLAPLWEPVYQAVPTIALQPTRTSAAARLRIWDATWHLYRRTVEIRDGQWALQAYLEESVRSAAEQRHRAAGLTGTELISAVVADQLRAALTAQRLDRPPQAPTDYADSGIRQDLRTPDDEVRALLRVAAHFDTHSAEQEAGIAWP